MKKRLESELISIAHRILKLKNKSELDQLYKETQKLYEILSVLKFYEDNVASLKNDISQEEIEEKIATSMTVEAQPIETPSIQEPIAEIKEEETTVEEEEIAAQLAEELIQEKEEEIVEEEIEKGKEEPIIVGEINIEEDNDEEVEDESFEDNDLVEEEDHQDADVETSETTFQPMFELGNPEEEEEIEEKPKEEIESKQITIEHFLGEDYKDPEFVKPNEITAFKSGETPATAFTLNDSLSKGIEVGLNDRIAFVKNLFADSNEDYNRVMSQLNTFDTLQEAKDFLNDFVIPEYNYWIGKEEYIERFMETVEKKFK
jgi:hypothetical protein